ncbi:hypothetical protein [Enterobacter sp.]|uniref:hypothetical protein n=1 Tax=Enterobacter sp. TaxID=42895 RepID=UPI00296F4927|nr:hypothetical protein [Enterobacter sp.]
MRSKDQLAVIAFLEQHRSTTPRRLARELGWDNKHTHNILGRLTRIGLIKNIGKPAHPENRLVQRWQAKIKPDAPAKKKCAAPPMATVCRENWQGYQIHKILGSARA